MEETRSTKEEKRDTNKFDNQHSKKKLLKNIVLYVKIIIKYFKDTNFLSWHLM
jgi:hypothetical protein